MTDIVVLYDLFKRRLDRFLTTIYASASGSVGEQRKQYLLERLDSIFQSSNESGG